MTTTTMPIYQTAEIRAFEHFAKERFGIANEVLMQRAGKAALDCLIRKFPEAKKIAIFCGTGNNGGDGYILARLAHERGMKVTVWQIGDVSKIKNETAKALQACIQADVRLRPFVIDADLQHPDVIVDAICGIGLTGMLREDIKQAISAIESLSLPVLAIDIPTGLHADTGKALGCALRAKVTITFIGLKLGLLTGEGMEYSGEVQISDLQLPTELFTSVPPIAEKWTETVLADCLPARPRYWHKGHAGHLLIVGGHPGFSGAVLMAAAAALRIGAGLVSIATHPEHAHALNVARPEIMVHGVRDAEELLPLLPRATTILLGPGLGQAEWSQRLWESVLNTALPLVMDADALNLLSQRPQKRHNWILTPHPGEAGRLLQQATTAVQADRLTALKKLTQTFDGFCVLKGAGTLIAGPEQIPILCDRGNPGMASAGMGDILSGVIAGLIAQGLPLKLAAATGVYLHAMAGDLAAKSGERGMIATDLLPFLRRLCNNPLELA